MSRADPASSRDGPRGAVGPGDREAPPYDHLAAFFTDVCYAIAAIVTAPFWLVRMALRGKLRTDWPARLGRGEAIPRTGRPRVLIHAVSVGEVNAIRGLVARLAADRLRCEVVVSTTTDTGFKRAQELFGSEHRVVRTPFDFSPAVRNWFDRVEPDALILVELELWPNMTRLAESRGVPIVVVNGRLSDRSIRGYRRARAIVASMFARATTVLAQNKTYADRFLELGAPEVLVTGNMKWDSVAIADAVPGASTLAGEFGLDAPGEPGAPRRPLVVAGSTEPGEELLLREALPKGARLLIAPRKPEWFDGVAANLPGCVRRSQVKSSGARGAYETNYFVLDTIGELRMAYALADVVVMGRSFGRLYGSDPIEPASLGKPVVIGPRVADFREVVDAFLAGGGIRQVDAAALGPMLAELCASTSARMILAAKGREVIRREQGGTARTAEVILAMLASRA